MPRTAPVGLDAKGQPDRTFFGGNPWGIQMRREFWAEDPLWTPPANGAEVSDFRDNGTEATDLIPQGATGAIPLYVASSNLNGRPALRFESGDQHMLANSSASGDVTFGAVVYFNSFPQGNNYVINRESGDNHVLAVEQGATVPRFRLLTGGLSRGSADGSAFAQTVYHMQAKAVTNHGEVFVNGSAVTDVDISGTAASYTGFILQGSGATSRMIGDVAYVYEYAGDLRSIPKYAEWETMLHHHYGVT